MSNLRRLQVQYSKVVLHKLKYRITSPLGYVSTCRPAISGIYVNLSRENATQGRCIKHIIEIKIIM